MDEIVLPKRTQLFPNRTQEKNLSELP